MVIIMDSQKWTTRVVWSNLRLFMNTALLSMQDVI